MTAFYGKLPAKGDFLSRNLPREFIDTWDDWLQSGMNASRQALGGGWLDTYLTSPLWRFALPAGICGTNAWTGVLMPSMDKVGRYFPMTVVKLLPPALSPICVAIQNEDWFGSVEATLLAALDNESLDMEEFDRTVQSFAFSEIDAASIDAPQQAGAGIRLALQEDLAIAKPLLAFASPEVQQRTAGFTVFWGSGSEHVAPGILLSKGLPGPQMFTPLLSGNWSAHGWQDAESSLPDATADPLARLLDDLVD